MLARLSAPARASARSLLPLLASTSCSAFHSSPALLRDVGGMNSRSKAAPRKAAEKTEGAPKKEKTDDEKKQREAARAEREKRKAEVRNSQKERAKTEKEKHASMTAKKQQRLQQAFEAARTSDVKWTAEEEAEYAAREAEEARLRADAAKKAAEAKLAAAAEAKVADKVE